jgi:hypothetical protein
VVSWRLGGGVEDHGVPETFELGNQSGQSPIFRTFDL